MTVPDVCEQFDPGFDDVDRRAPFTINGATPLVVPLTIRIALLAALSRT